MPGAGIVVADINAFVIKPQMRKISLHTKVLDMMAGSLSLQDHFKVREAVGVFRDSETFERSVETLEEAGFDRAAISMLASKAAVNEKLGHLFEETSEISEHRAVSQAIFASRHDVAEGKAAAIGIPAYIGGIGAGVAIVASGGTLGIAGLVAAAGAAAGAGIGALFAHAVGEHHAEAIKKHLASGGLILTVRVHDEPQEARAMELLGRSGAHSVHAHTVIKDWGENDIPLHDFNPDPLLEAELR